MIEKYVNVFIKASEIDRSELQYSTKDESDDDGDSEEIEDEETDTKKADTKKADTKKADAKKTDAKKTDAKKADAKKTEDKKVKKETKSSDELYSNLVQILDVLIKQYWYYYFKLSKIINRWKKNCCKKLITEIFTFNSKVNANLEDYENYKNYSGDKNSDEYKKLADKYENYLPV